MMRLLWRRHAVAHGSVPIVPLVLGVLTRRYREIANISTKTSLTKGIHNVYSININIQTHHQASILDKNMGPTQTGGQTWTARVFIKIKCELCSKCIHKKLLQSTALSSHPTNLFTYQIIVYCTKSSQWMMLIINLLSVLTKFEDQELI